MKKQVVALAIAALMMAATGAMAATSIKNTKHDLSSGSTGATFKSTNTNQICVFCHTPHNATQNIPLWNRTNPGGGGFTLYSSIGMKNKPAKSGFTADSISLFCMSCHDGSTQLGGAVNNKPADAKAGITMAGGNNLITGAANLGTDLANDHPVNFFVDSAVTNAANGLGDVTGGKMKTAAVTNGFSLFKSARGATSLECGSCHAVHDNTDVPFLRTTMSGSLLCLGCHVK